MSIKFKFIICWLWSNKEQIFEDILLYADTLDLLNLCFVLFCEMLRVYGALAKPSVCKCPQNQ